MSKKVYSREVRRVIVSHLRDDFGLFSEYKEVPSYLASELIAEEKLHPEVLYDGLFRPAFENLIQAASKHLYAQSGEEARQNILRSQFTTDSSNTPHGKPENALDLLYDFAREVSYLGNNRLMFSRVVFAGQGAEDYRHLYNTDDMGKEVLSKFNLYFWHKRVFDDTTKRLCSDIAASVRYVPESLAVGACLPRNSESEETFKRTWQLICGTVKAFDELQLKTQAN